ncbi:transglycosylase domain-containing protein [Pedobacter deserti]|uniref:transglycosylase domain-containing protein n=1 Tax=Pedobacter deserti TaxID=2817382 RepID=UPI00210AD805|nr:biosynthetic peptidoglycan transglycosylase [Pedobacter sp. SYSU D00382]
MLPKKLNIPAKYLKMGAWIIGVILLLLLVFGTVAYTKRESLLKKVMAKAVNKADSDYDLLVKIGSADFSGLSTVRMKSVTVVPKERDTLLTISDMTVGVKLFPLLFGDVKLSEVNLTDGKVQAVFRDSVSNLDFILKRKKRENAESQGELNLADVAHNIVNQLLYKIPDQMAVKNFVLDVNDNDTAKLSFRVIEANIDDGDFSSTVLVNSGEATWHLSGLLKPGKKQLDVKLYAEKGSVELPYLNNKLHARIRFDTVRTQMTNAHNSGEGYRIEGSWAVHNLLFNHSKIASNDIVIRDARIDADMLVGKNYVALDSSSSIFLRDVELRPYLKYTLKPNKIYELKLRIPEQDAQQLFNSLPAGLFESLEGIKVAGKVRYDLYFHLDSSIPDSVKFSSGLTPNGFKILQWGKTNLQKINKDFIYTPYEYGKPMRDILIGPANANFTPLNEVSSNFKNAILTSEDPSFFSHKGFVQESIRKSFAVNFKEKRFVRGGSTISMQLVKNVFLSRQKTLARKAEEILIVWLIENNRLISKNRMLEVYFNIIEMGQNIYGIGEASRHYFGKHPSELNIGEGIFLANIVPRPKIAMYKFGSDGGLKGYMYNYFRYIGNIMARRGLTPPDTNGYGFYTVRLREGLRQYLLPDSATIDTNAVELDDQLPPIETQDDSKSLFDRLFGGSKRDTVSKTAPSDTVEKSRRELRRERREQRRRENNTEQP